MSAVLKPEAPHALPNALEQLVPMFIEAKRAEDAAKKARVEIEERILAVAPAREEGSVTLETGGYKVTTTGGLSYSIDDMDAFRNITKDWDANLVPLKTKTEADEVGFKYLRRERADLWSMLAKVVTVKPRKTSVKVSA